MIIHDLDHYTHGGAVGAVATIVWEDCARPERQIYIDTDARFAGHVHCDFNAFLLAVFTPAMRHGERRVLVEGTAYPQLRNGLITAMQILRRWYGEARHQRVAIEATEGFAPAVPREPAHTASFLSGGVDTLAKVRSNRLDFPLDHPGSIADGFFVHGLDVGGYERLQNNRDSSNLAESKLAEHDRFLVRMRQRQERLQTRERRKQRLKRFDQQYLGGRLIGLKRRLAGQGKDA